MENAVKKHPIPKKPGLFILLITMVLAAAAAALLLPIGKSDGLPEMKLRGKTYACGMPFEMTEKLYVNLAEKYDCSIGTRSVDGEEFISTLSARKPWPDSKPNRAASIGGLRLGDKESKLLETYPQADTNGLRITAGIYNPDETWEHFTVYFYEDQTYSPTEYDALLHAASEQDADNIRIHSYAMVVLTIGDEIDCIAFGDYADLIDPIMREMDAIRQFEERTKAG